MLIKLHRQATTMPKIRAAIPARDEPARVLAERHGTTEPTLCKWRKRDSVAELTLQDIGAEERSREMVIA